MSWNWLNSYNTNSQWYYVLNNFIDFISHSTDELVTFLTPLLEIKLNLSKQWKQIWSYPHDSENLNLLLDCLQIALHMIL